MMLTAACVFVRGHVDYGVEYVTRLRDMAHKLLPAHRFLCFTDRPQLMPRHVQPVVIPPAARGVKAWWSKLQLFNPAHGLLGRVVYFDLDVVLLRDLDAIVDYPADFALIPDGAGKLWRPPDGKGCVRRFNSSVMVWEAGAVNSLFTGWTPDAATRLWGDQDWIGERMPDAVTMPLEWFPRISACRGEPPDSVAKVLLCKTPKNVAAARQYTWVREAWQ